MHKKLTDYQKAEIWSLIGLSAFHIEENAKKKQDLIQLRMRVEELEGDLKKLTNHEIALAIEEGKKK